MQVLDNFLDADESNHQRIHHAHHSGSSTASSDHVAVEEENGLDQNSIVQSTNVGGSGTPLATSSVHSTTSAAIDTDNLDSNEDLTEEMKAQIRSERKRTREKQRRSDVNSQFTSLTELLQRVEGYDLDSDVSDDENESETKKRKINSVGAINVAPSNRVDLISRTIAVMDRLHTVNRSLRQNVKGLRKTLKKVNGTMGGGDDLNKPDMTNGNNFMNGQMQGMMMMTPQQMGMGMGMMGQNMGSGGGGGGGGDSQQPMMMMVPMMMPNSMMQQQQQQNGGTMPGMNQSFNMGMGMQNQIQSSQGHPSQTSHQNQNRQHQLQHHPGATANQLNNAMNAANTNTRNAITPNANVLNQMPFLHGQNSSHGNGNGNAQNQSMNASQMGMQMAVFNPITNAWNTPQQQQQQQHGHSNAISNANGASSHSHSQGHTSTNANANAHSSSNNGHGSGNGNDNGSFSYGGNLAHCA